MRLWKKKTPLRAAEVSDEDLFPNGTPTTETDLSRMFELYKLMVASSEALVGRRQGVNTFFLTANGALLTAAGLILANGSDARIRALGLLVLSVTGVILSAAWHSLLLSFGQLNNGKFAVINRIEKELPAAVYDAEWKALKEGEDPETYRTFTSREVWTPQTFLTLFCATAVVEIIVATFA